MILFCAREIKGSFGAFLNCVFFSAVNGGQNSEIPWTQIFLCQSCQIEKFKQRVQTTKYGGSFFLALAVLGVHAATKVSTLVFGEALFRVLLFILERAGSFSTGEESEKRKESGH